VEAVSTQFIEANSVLLAFQGLLVAFTGAGVPAWLQRAAGRGWALILPLSISSSPGSRSSRSSPTPSRGSR
jgi:hypothetical protein